MDRKDRDEDALSSLVLENIKARLIHAFRAAAEPEEESQRSGSRSCSTSIRRCLRANEELRRAQIDGALTWLRSELQEMRSQDLQLARTLLGLNSQIQRLRRESCGGAGVGGHAEQ